MKKLSVLLPLVLLLALLVGCAGAPEQETEVEGEVEVEEVKVIDHKNKALGGDVPGWVFASPMDLEEEDKFADSYVFKVEEDGGSLDGLKAWASGFSVPTEIARFVSTRVKNKFAGAQVGDKDMIETYMENVTKSLAEAQFSGARRRDDYWVKKQEGEDKFYTYIMLVTVPKAMIDDAIDRALQDEGAKAQPKTEEEKTARARTREIFSEGL